MKTGKLRKTTSFWKSLFFMGNICKMRTALASYLHEEGLKCEIADGEVGFEFNDFQFSATLDLHDGIGECTISFEFEDEKYEKLEMKDKTFIADRVNIDQENHVTLLAYVNSFEAVTSFYFTSKDMLINFFSLHFKELTESIDEAFDILKQKIDDQKRFSGRRIGFNTDLTDIESSVEMQVAAKATTQQ